MYILASKKNGVLYVGVTNNLIRRVLEHKNCINKCFTSRYKVFKLVYYSYTESILDAIAYEKRLKNWKRQWKIDLIEKENPRWRDLYYNLVG